MNACMQCKYESHLPMSPYTWCTHPTMDKSPIHGGSKVECKDARAKDGHCGKKGRLFEQRVSWFKRTFGG